MRTAGRTGSLLGGSGLAFVVGANLRQRHLTFHQTVGVALKLRRMLAEEAKTSQVASLKEGRAYSVSPKSGEQGGKSVQQAAKQVRVGKRAVGEMLSAEKSKPRLADPNGRKRHTIYCGPKRQLRANGTPAAELAWEVGKMRTAAQCKQ